MDIYTSNSLAQVISGTGNMTWFIIFLAVMIFFALYSTVLIFHWFSFSMHTRTAILATSIYLVISAVFVFSMLVSVVTLATL